MKKEFPLNEVIWSLNDYPESLYEGIERQLRGFDAAVREGLKDGDLDYLVYLLKKKGFWE